MILDVGCGDGKRGDIGIDIQPNDSVDVICDSHSLPFRGDIFDKVVSNHALEHFDNPKKALDEQIRVLKEGGKCYAKLPRWSSCLMGGLIYYGLRIFRPSVALEFHRLFKSGQHKWQFSSEWLVKTFQKLGFKDVELIRPGNKIVFGRFGKFLAKKGFRMNKEYCIKGVK